MFEERYEIQNTGRMPRLWMEVQDESHLPGAGTSQVFTMIGGHESRSFMSRTRLQERGVFRLGPTVLTSGDIFGLFPAARTIPSEDDLLIYPKLYDVQSFPNPPGLLPGGEALRRRTPQITSNAAGVREYTPGDPLNRIHWASTARRNRLIVKEFELDPLAEVWLYLDASRHTQAARPTRWSSLTYRISGASARSTSCRLPRWNMRSASPARWQNFTCSVAGRWDW